MCSGSCHSVDMSRRRELLCCCLLLSAWSAAQEALLPPSMPFPAGVVIDVASNTIQDVKFFVDKLAATNEGQTSVLLSTFYQSGTATTERLSNLTELLQAVRRLQAPGQGGVAEDSFSPAMRALLNQSQTLPAGSAILLFTDRQPSDTKLQETLESNLLSQRIQLFVAWMGNPGKQETVLQQVATKSGGKLAYMTQPKLKNLDEDTIYTMDGVQGSFRFDISVTEEIVGLDIAVDGVMAKASLTDPKGNQIDLLREARVKPGQRFLRVRVATPSDGWTRVATWALHLEAQDKTERYDVTIKAIRKGEERSAGREGESPVPPPVSLGSEQLRFPDSDEAVDMQGKQKPTNLTLSATAAQQKITPTFTIPIIVELAKGAVLEVRPGTTTLLQYEVTNNQNYPVSAFFRATQENLIITNVQPMQSFLQPYSSLFVQVSVTSPANAGAGGIGKVTLFVDGGTKPIWRSAMVYFTTATTSDTWNPDIWYKYQGDCKNHNEPSTCEGGQWSVEATLRDEDSGLLRVMSEPYGLIFKSEFIAGTKAPVYVTYVSSCCKPKLQIWAEDLKGNYVKRDLDVYNQGLLAGEIAAVVIGVLLLILLIVVIIVAIILCRRRKQSKLELPRHRAGSR